MSENFSLRETEAVVQVEWRNERFRSLTEEPECELHSPAFSLSDAQWFLEMRTYPYFDDPFDTWMCLNLHKRFSTSKKLELIYTLGIRRRDGSVYESFDWEDDFQKFGAPGTHSFAHRYIFNASKLMQSENVLTSDGTLKVFATVRLADPTVLDEVQISRELPFRATHTEEVSSEWKVEDFISLPKDCRFCLESPTFPLAGATWCMSLCPNNSYFYSDDSRWVSLYLSRKRSSSEKQTVAFTLGIRRRDGTPHRLIHREKEFTNNNTGIGRSYFMMSSELLDPENGLVNEGSVTFFCTARAKPSPLTTAAITERGVQTSSDPSHEERTSLTTTSECYKPSQSTCEILHESFRNFFLSERLSDAVITVQDQKLPAHRVILSARSPVFSSMFEHDTEERRTDIVNIEDFDAASFRAFLAFLYSGDVEIVSADNAIPLYKAADKYNLPDLRKECLQCLQNGLNLGSLCEVAKLAFMHSETILLEAATEFFVDNAKEIVVTSEWQTMMTEHPALTNELVIKVLTEKP